ncbi:GNAT family N-acetyltransferase [Oceaniglobus roseus]|uniref:GNAT family N-acetyltransferase n=1 Tax=Oceaniglobus roseus TaxID=1737570 RepID=UPI000C7F3150|nr:GNAT family N-acetyltransferase [Kandeliimicrobium roseum]
MTDAPGIRRAADPADWAALHRLLHRCFAGMEGRIDPPSSLHRLTPQDIAATAARETVLVIGPDAAPHACLFCTWQPDALYLGKLAVDPARRGRGLARALIDAAEAIARAEGLPRLRLQTRVELTENHATFTALGFSETGRTAHEGFDRPTSINFERALTP